MGNITELISDLDAKREKATQWEWKNNDQGGFWRVEDKNGNEVFDDGSAGDEYAPSCNEDDRDYIIALHNAFLELRQAVLDGERYKAAGEALAKAIDGTDLTSWSTFVGEDPDKQWNDCNNAWRHEAKHWVYIYRSATNQNEV